MKKMNELQKILKEFKHELEFRYHVSDLALFGSYVRGEENAESDLDVLVSFSESISLFQFIELEERLSELLGVKVDLVSRKALKPRIGERILKEAVAV